MFSKNAIISIVAVLVSNNIVLAAPTSGKSYESANNIGYKSLIKAPGALGLKSKPDALASGNTEISSPSEPKSGFEVADILRKPLESGKIEVGYKRPSKKPGNEKESVGPGSGSVKPDLEYTRNPSGVESEDSSNEPEESNNGESSGELNPSKNNETTDHKLPGKDIESNGGSGNYSKETGSCIVKDVPSVDSDSSENDIVDDEQSSGEIKSPVTNDSPKDNSNGKDEGESSVNINDAPSKEAPGTSYENSNGSSSSGSSSGGSTDNNNSSDNVSYAKPPTEGSGSSKPIDADNNSSDKVSYAKPNKNNGSGKPNNPVDGNGSVKPNKPVDGNGSVEPNKPVDGNDSVKPGKPDEGNEYKKPGESVEDNGSSKPDESIEGIGSVKPDESVEGYGSGKPIESVEGNGSIKPTPIKVDSSKSTYGYQRP